MQTDRGQKAMEFDTEASRTRDYCVAKERDASRGSPRSFVRAKNALSQDDNRSLLLRGEVAFAGTHLQVFFHRRDFDGAVAAVGIEIGGLVGDHVLAA